ncbi:MAG: trypsin-like peptidase domain-containing protein [Burkholderiaceae bacterium]|nr:trypsin-like peptidase domain-containing protein [Burkholderiaceae bacterium]
MRKLWLVFSQAVTVALAVLFVVNTLKPQWLARTPVAGQPDVVAIRTAPPPAAVVPLNTGSLSSAVRRAAPAVVSVSAIKAGRNNPHERDPWYRYFFGDRAQGEMQRGVGSGVIVSAQGYLLTNNHVVEGASEIEIGLNDGREAKARLIGTDPDTDMAVLKIDIDKLPSITLGNVEALQVGDQVLAIGNPFNVGQTVTSGIVSALGRNQLGLSTFENFIQTDAPINPGNSGGALVDVNGQLIGINTAIFSRSGGSMGIGFAIPVDLARQVMEGLIKDGKVTRGWIGVEPRDLPAEYVESFRLPIKDGVLITGVLQDGPAQRSGLKPGDVVTTIGDRPVANTTQLLNAVAALKPGSEAAIGVQRGAQALQLKLTVGQRPPTQRRAPQ